MSMTKRQYGTGSVSWLSPTKAWLRIRLGGAADEGGGRHPSLTVADVGG